MAHHLETATSVWSTAGLAAALPAAEAAAEGDQSENIPPPTEPQHARRGPFPLALASKHLALDNPLQTWVQALGRLATRLMHVFLLSMLLTVAGP